MTEDFTQLADSDKNTEERWVLYDKILLNWLTQIKTQKRGEYFMTEDFTQLADSDKNTEER